MHPEVTKDNKWTNRGGKKLFEKMFFSKRKISSLKSLLTKYYIIQDPVGSKKATDAIVASGMRFRSCKVLTKFSNSTMCQKYGKNTVFDPS